jgi:hypothetical protein
MSVQESRQAEKIYRDILREFAFSFRGLARNQVPTLTLCFSCSPPEVDSKAEKHHLVTRSVFEAFCAVLLRETVVSERNPKQHVMRVWSFEKRDCPWFDILVERSGDSFNFEVCYVHPILSI